MAEKRNSRRPTKRGAPGEHTTRLQHDDSTARRDSRIDFDAINARLLGRSRELLPQWFPNGKLRGHEFIVGNLQGDPGESLSINVDSGKWADFANPEVSGRDLVSLYAAMRGVKQSEAARELAPELVPAPVSKRSITDVYDYVSAEGELLFQVVRYEPKDFRQRRPDGSGDWIWNLRGVDLVPYRLPAVIAQVKRGLAVFVVEGEKDSDALAGIGCVATCNAGGAGKWRSEFNRWFEGAKVVILPDADAPGRAHAAQVAKSLQGVAASVAILELPGLPPKGDVSDWLAAGGTKAALSELAKQALAKPADNAPSASDDTRETETALERVDLSALADTALDPTKWAIERLLPRGHVTLLGSHGGAGKSLLATVLAAHVACGARWAGRETERGRALIVSLEDYGDLGRFRLRRVCDAYGLSHAEVAEGVILLDGSASDSVLAEEANDAGMRRLHFTATLDEIEAAAEGCRLVVIDNASDAFDGNENERRIVRAFVRRLARMARKRDCAVLLLAHVDKSAARYGSNGNTYSGSTAWHNTVRSRLALLENDGHIQLVQEKLNLGKKLDGPVDLAWTGDGVLMPISASGSEARARDAEDDAAVLAAIEAAIKDGATVHAARDGSHSALATLRRYPDLPKALRKDTDRFYAALTRLERASRVVRETYRNAQRKDRVRLSVCATFPPIPPLATGAPVGASPVRQSGDERLAQDWRKTGALAQKECRRCGGEGCSWCRA